MTTREQLIKALHSAKQNNLSIGECWNLMDAAADMLEADERHPLSIERIVSMNYRGTEDEHIRAVRMTELAHGIGVTDAAGTQAQQEPVAWSGDPSVQDFAKQKGDVALIDTRTVVQQLVDALDDIDSLEGDEKDEWDGVERVIPKMAEIARTAREAGYKLLQALNGKPA